MRSSFVSSPPARSGDNPATWQSQQALTKGCNEKLTVGHRQNDTLCSRHVRPPLWGDSSQSASCKGKSLVWSYVITTWPALPGEKQICIFFSLKCTKLNFNFLIPYFKSLDTKGTYRNSFRISSLVLIYNYDSTRNCIPKFSYQGRRLISGCKYQYFCI